MTKIPVFLIGMNQTRPDSNSSTKSTNAVYQQLQGNRDREFRSQQPAGHANSSVQSRGATYRTNQADHLGSMENRGAKVFDPKQLYTVYFIYVCFISVIQHWQAHLLDHPLQHPIIYILAQIQQLF
jgi:hypothetical protein